MSKITPHQASIALADICSKAPVIPVLTLKDTQTAKDLGQALVNGGLPILEVTLRSDSALAGIREMAQIKGAIVGAGTLLAPDDVKQAKDAGAVFGVSPGATDEILSAAESCGLPMLAGAATPTEAMRLATRGYRVQKFFPAQAAGGVGMLKSLGAPLPDINFCPTGGVTPSNAPEYLQLKNVVCVGGSWVVPNDLYNTHDWAAIEALAKQAAALG